MLLIRSRSRVDVAPGAVVVRAVVARVVAAARADAEEPTPPQLQHCWRGPKY